MKLFRTFWVLALLGLLSAPALADRDYDDDYGYSRGDHYYGGGHHHHRPKHSYHRGHGYYKRPKHHRGHGYYKRHKHYRGHRHYYRPKHHHRRHHDNGWAITLRLWDEF
jgi:hypothetical protein